MEFALARKGFGAIWRKWILGCLSSRLQLITRCWLMIHLVASLLLNGVFVKQSVISVITIVADAFRVLIFGALQRNLFSGFRVGKDVVEVFDLQYGNAQFFETCYILL